MTIQVLPSGRWRARVWVPGGGDAAVGRVLGDGPASFETWDEAADAVERARNVLRETYGRSYRRCRVARPKRVYISKKAWNLASKGEATCRVCDDDAVHLHHVIPVAVFPAGVRELDRNAIPICAACHSGWHHRTIEVPHTLLRDVEFTYACAAMGPVWVGRHYYDGNMAAEQRLFLIEEPQGRLFSPHDRARSVSPLRVEKKEAEGGV